MSYIFGLSVSCMVLYRIISGYVIYRLTRSWIRVCTQLIDMELFRVLYVAHKYKLSKKSSPQRLISNLEAVFEAAPQTLLQLIFLMKTDGLNETILLSVILSFVNLTSSAISDDKTLPGFMVNNINLPLRWTEKLKTLSALYLFPACDIPSHILCLCFLWRFIHGSVLTIVICIDCIIVLILYWKTNKCTDALMGLVALPLSYGETANVTFMHAFWTYRILWIVSANITLWIHITQDTQSRSVIALWWFASLGSVIKFPLLWVMHRFVRRHCSYWYRRSKERGNMAAMCETGLYSDVIELMVYIHTSPKSSDLVMDVDNKPLGTFLWAVYRASAGEAGLAACKDADWTLFNKMIETHGIDLCDSNCMSQTWKCCNTALHGVLGDEHLPIEKRVDLTKKLLQKATLEYLKALNHKGMSLLMLVARSRIKQDAPLIMDLIWQKLNDLYEKETNQEDEKEESHLLFSTDDKRIEYLNTVDAQGTRFALEMGVYEANYDFLRKFLSMYPTSDSKRDIIFRTDLPEHTSFLLGCVSGKAMLCWDVFWKEIEDCCNDDPNRNEIITNYLNVQMIQNVSYFFGDHGYYEGKGSTALMLSLGTNKTKGFFVKVLNCYPSLLSKQEALKMKNGQGQDALQILKDNCWNETEKEETMEMIESVLNRATEDIGTITATSGQMTTGVTTYNDGY
eukprot:208434_1